MDPKTLLVEAAYHAVKWLVDKIRHAGTSADEAELREIAKKGAEAAVQRVTLELQLRGFAIATEVLDAAAQELLAAMHAAEKTPSILPAAEIVSEITDADRAAEKASFDSLRTEDDIP